MTKTLTVLSILTIISISCNDNQNEFDKNELIEKLRGNWIINTSYEGFIVNKDTIRNVPINYPTYKISMTSERIILLYLVENNIDELIIEGSFDINAGQEITFDKNVSEKLKDIGYFDVDPASDKYLIRKLNSTDLNLEYTYITTDNNKQFDGFFIKRI